MRGEAKPGLAHLEKSSALLLTVWRAEPLFLIGSFIFIVIGQR